MIVACVFIIVPVILFFVAKYYFQLLEKLHLKGGFASKLQMFLLWTLACLIIFLGVYFPIIALKNESPQSELGLGILPLLASMIAIFLFQRDDIKRIGLLLNKKK